MEKFRTFEDPATGIMPFMPAKVVVPKSIPLRLGRAIVSILLSAIRLPFLIVVLLLVAVESTLVSLVPLGFVRRPLQRMVDFVGCRLLLFILGFWWIPASWEKRNTISAKGKADQGWPPCNQATSGTLLISNCCSYLDLLYLSFRFSPVYAIPIRDPKSPKCNGFVIPCGMFGAIYDLLFYPSQDEARSISISHLVDKTRKSGSGPVCIMPEGISSNDSSILPFLAPVGGSPGLEQCPWIGGKAPTCYACVLRYPFRFASPYFSSGSFLAHVLNMTCQIFNTMEVVFLPPRVTEIKARDQGLSPSERSEGTFAAHLVLHMAAAASTPKKKVRLVVPRCGVTNESAGEVISAVRVKKLFRDAYSNH